MNVCIAFNAKYSEPEAIVSQIMGRDAQQAAKHLRIQWCNYEGKGDFTLPPQPSRLKYLTLKCMRLNVFLNLPVS